MRIRRGRKRNVLGKLSYIILVLLEYKLKMKLKVKIENGHCE